MVGQGLRETRDRQDYQAQMEEMENLETLDHKVNIGPGSSKCLMLRFTLWFCDGQDLWEIQVEMERKVFLVSLDPLVIKDSTDGQVSQPPIAVHLKGVIVSVQPSSGVFEASLNLFNFT